MKILAVQILLFKVKHLFIVCYRSPSTDVNNFITDLQSVLRLLAPKYPNISVLWDFNVPDICWFQGVRASLSLQDNEFLEIVSELSLTQLILSSTSHGNILDLVLTNYPESFSDIEVLKHSFNSDHYPLFSIRCNCKNRLSNTIRHEIDFNKADFGKIRNVCYEVTRLL